MENAQKQLSNILHTLFCNLPHEEDPLKVVISTKCCYYLEENVDVCWKMKDHTYWAGIADTFKKFTGSMSQQKVLDQTVNLVNAVNFLAANDKLFDLITKLLRDER